jgi:hypothetical protein
VFAGTDYVPSDEELAQANWTREQWNAINKAATPQVRTTSSGGGNPTKPTYGAMRTAIENSTNPMETFYQYAEYMDDKIYGELYDVAESLANVEGNTSDENGDTDDIASYVNTLVVDNNLTDDQAANIRELLGKSWVVVNKGWINFGGGMDKDAVVACGDGITYEEFKIIDLYNKLIEYGVPEDDAESFIINLQDDLGI